MTPLTVSLPEALNTYLQEQIAAGHYSTADDYIQALIQQDKDRKAHLENLMLEALDSPASPMTEEDWDTIRSTVRQKLSQGRPNA